MTLSLATSSRLLLLRKFVCNGPALQTQIVNARVTNAINQRRLEFPLVTQHVLQAIISVHNCNFEFDSYKNIFQLKPYSSYVPLKLCSEKLCQLETIITLYFFSAITIALLFLFAQYFSKIRLLKCALSPTVIL